MCVRIYLCMRTFFQAKQIILTFWDVISLKIDLGLEIQKINVGIRIVILKILCQCSGKTNKFDFFLWYYKLSKRKYNIRYTVSKLLYCKHSGKNKIRNKYIFTFFAQICLKMDLQLEIDKVNVRIIISALTICCVSIFW